MAMHEHPILFSGSMVRAILDGRKTQTRRVIIPQPEFMDGGWFWRGGKPLLDATYGADYVHTGKGALVDALLKTSRHQPGDRLWVRESWQVAEALWSGDDFDVGSPFKSIPKEAPKDGTYYLFYAADGMVYPFRPSIHMPRWASRITLEVKAVRAELVQDISTGGEMFKSDVIHEGCPRELWACHQHDMGVAEADWFQKLWDSINAKRGYGWNKNPWVRVTEFEMVSDAAEG